MRLAPIRIATAFLALCALTASAQAEDSPFAWLFPSPKLPQLHRRHERPLRSARAFLPPVGSGRDLYALVTAAAAKHGVPPRLAHAIVRIESGYRCTAVAADGGLGIMQVMPQTAAGVGIGGNLLECATGLEAGMRYLAMAIRAAGAGCNGASLYNRGLYAKPKCTAYGRRVMSLAGTAAL